MRFKHVSKTEKNTPRTPQDASQASPRRVQDDPKPPQDAPTTPSRRLQIVWKSARLPRSLQDSPRRSQDASKTPQDPLKTPPRRSKAPPKTAQDAPKLPDEKKITKPNKRTKPTDKKDHPYQLFQPNPPMTYKIKYSNAFPLIHFSRPGGMREAFKSAAPGRGWRAQNVT